MAKTLSELLSPSGGSSPSPFSASQTLSKAPGTTLSSLLSKKNASTLSEQEQWAQTSEERRAQLAQAGRKDPTVKKPGAGDIAMGILAAPGTATNALLYNATNKESTKDVSVLGETWKSLKGEERLDTTDTLREWGVENEFGLIAGGIALSVLTDPMTYISSGVSAAAKLKAAEKVVGLLDDMKKVDTVIDSVNAAGKAIKINSTIAAKYGDEVAELIGDATSFGEKGLANHKVQSKIASILRLQTADELAGKAGKSGIRFMGQRIPGTKQLPEMLSRGLKDTAATLPGAGLFQKAFTAPNIGKVWEVMGETGSLTKPLTYKGPGELARIAARASVRGELTGLRAADNAGTLAKEWMEARIPDKRIRTAVTIGIGRQFTSVDSLYPVTKARAGIKLLKEAVRKGTPGAADNLKAAEAELAELVKSLVFDENAIETAIRTGVPDATEDAILDAVEATKELQTNLADIGARRVAASKGPNAKTTALEDVLREKGSLGYTYGIEGKIDPEVEETLRRLNPKIDFDALKPIDDVTERVGPRFDGTLDPTPDVDAAKSLPNTEARLEMGIESETDLAAWYGAKVRADERSIAHANFKNDLSKISGLDVNDPIIADAIEKLSEPFTSDEATRRVLKVFDWAQNQFKLMATALNIPRFQTRNAMSGQYLQWANNAWSAKAQKESTEFIIKVGKVIKGKAPFSSLDEVTRKELVEMLDNGVLVAGKDLSEIRPTVTTLREALGGAAPAIDKAKSVGATIKKPLDAWAKAGMDLNALVENHGRIAVYKKAISEGMNPSQAAQWVDEVLYSYDPKMMTAFENNIMKRAYPFYTWMRRNTPQLLKVLVKNPKAWGIPMTAVRESQNAAGVDPDTIPSYLEDMGLTYLPGKDENGDQTAIKLFDSFAPITQAKQAMDLPFDPLGGLRDLSAQGSPLIKLPIELATNYSMFRDDVIEGGYQGTNRRVSGGVQMIDDLVRDTPAWKAWVESQGGYWDVDRNGRTILMLPGRTAHFLGGINPTMENAGRLSPNTEGYEDNLFGWMTGVKPQRMNAAELETKDIQSDYFELGDAIGDYKKALKAQKLTEARNRGASDAEIERIREAMDGITLDELLGGGR